MTGQYDAIIVGARCSGAALGTHLARAGSRVLLLDAAKLPSDLVLSTHFVQPPGVDALDELGVGERLRKAAPPTKNIFLNAESAGFVANFTEGRPGYCIRRFKLDAWLQEAATSAGAELRDRSRVVDLLRDGDRVAGVVVETEGVRESIRADLVVGADGPHSTIAELTGVEEYLGFEFTRAAYWGYWPMPACWKSDERRHDQIFAYEGDGYRIALQGDDERLLLVASPPRTAAETWGREYRERYVEYLRASPFTAPLVEGNAPIGKTIGIVSARGFYRRPVGPGFALVGDAGTFKDWVTGQGITDALLGAKRLARAIIDGREAAFMHYWRERDVLTLPLYFDAWLRGEVGANHAFMRLLFERMGGSPALAARPGLMLDRKISPFELVPTATLVGWVLGAVLRGRFDVIRPFIRDLRRLMGFQKEMQRRYRLHAEATAALDGS